MTTDALDPRKLVLAGAALSFAISPFASPTYNLPLFLFGVLVHEASDAVQPLKLFCCLLAASIFADVVWLFNNDQNGFIRFLSLLLWLLKLPTAATFFVALRQSGAHFMPLGPDINGPTVWSMPGGFTSGGRDGYQVVDDEPRVAPPARPLPSQKGPATSAPQPSPGIQPGNYQSA